MFLALLAIVAVVQDAGLTKLGIHHATIADLREPVAVAFTHDGRLLVSEAHANRVSLFDAAGARVATFGESGEGALLDPRGIALSDAGNELFVVDSGHQRIVAFGLDGSFRGAFGSYGGGAGELRDPRGIAVRRQLVAVADTGNERVQLFATSGEPVRSIASGIVRCSDVAFDDAGALFASDTTQHRVVKLDVEGAHSIAFGDFGPHAGFFAAPQGLATRAGELYVVDTDNHRVQVFDAQSKLAYEWGLHALRPREGAGYLHYPSAVAISRDGALAAVAEPFEDRVQLFRRTRADEMLPINRVVDRTISAHFGPTLALDGDLLAIVEPGAPALLLYDVEHELEPWEPINITRWTAWGSGFGQLLAPSDAALDFERQRLYVADFANATLMQLGFTHDRSRALGYDPFLLRLVRSFDFRAGRKFGLREFERAVHPSAIAVAPNGEIWVLDAAQRVLVALTPELACVREPLDLGSLVRPIDFALASDGRVFVVDELSERVSILGASGIATLSLPGAVRPAGIALDSDGNVYVSDAALNRVQKLAATGELLATFGTPGLGAGQFHKPRGLAFDEQGRLIALDWGNHRAQLFTQAGEFVTAFGARLFVQPTREKR